MPATIDDPDAFDDEDDEDDADDESPDEDLFDCPECGSPIYGDSEKCPACGSWVVTPDDATVIWSPAGKPAMKFGALLILAFLAFLLVSVFVAFGRR